MATDDEGSKRVPVTFTCSDEAYDRLFRRKDGRDGYHRNRGQRLDEVLTKFCDIVEAQNGITLLHPPADSRQARNRSLLVDRAVKERFDRVAASVPVPAQALYREAIFRFTGAC